MSPNSIPQLAEINFLHHLSVSYLLWHPLMKLLSIVSEVFTFGGAGLTTLAVNTTAEAWQCDNSFCVCKFSNILWLVYTRNGDPTNQPSIFLFLSKWQATLFHVQHSSIQLPSKLPSWNPQVLLFPMLVQKTIWPLLHGHSCLLSIIFYSLLDFCGQLLSSIHRRPQSAWFCQCLLELFNPLWKISSTHLLLCADVLKVSYGTP